MHINTQTQLNMKNCRLLILGLLALAAGGASAEVTLSDVIGNSSLYGYLLNEDAGTAKWNKLSADGTVSTVWEDANYSEKSIKMQSGWMKDGILCGFGLQASGGYATAFGYMERNVVNGDIYSQKVTRYSVVPKDKTFNSAVYMKSDDTIYGYGSYARSMAFKKAAGNGDYSNSEELFQLTDPYEWCPAMCIDPATGQMYGITFGQAESQLLTIDKEGFSDVVASLSVKSSNAPSALAYFPETGYFLWSNSNEGVSALYAIKLADGSCEKICDLGEDDLYTFFVTDSHADGCGIPALPEMLVDSFEAPSTSGYITYAMPNTDLNGEDLVSETYEMTWVALVDGEEYQTGVKTMGSTVRVDYTDLTSGMHTFGFYVEINGLRSGTLQTEKYIGYDTPLKPENLVLELDGDNRLTARWDAVTAGVHNGYLNTADMKYEVFLDGESKGTVTETTWSYDLDPDAQLAAYIVTVAATSHDMTSETAKSNAVVAGKPLEANVTFAPTEADASLMTYPNDNGLRWKYNTSFTPAVFSVSHNYDSDEPSNTWLIFPAINFPKTEDTYKLEYQNGTYATYCKGEYYEIWIGKEPTVEAMTVNIKDKTNVIPTDGFASEPVWNDNSLEFEVPEAGVWYIGFKACPDADNMGQILLNIILTTIPDDNAVEDVTDDATRSVAAYYNAQGMRLAERPAKGFYITVYTDGTCRKHLAR